MRNKAFALYLTCLTVTIMSCGERRLKHDLKQLMQTEIHLPENLRQVVSGKDSLVMDWNGKHASLIFFIDSTECSSCRISQMYKYWNVIDYKDVVGEQFIPVFIFSPPEHIITALLDQLCITNFDYPILLDEVGAFHKANPHIPANNRFHIFLIDKNGKVVLVGDPVNNPQLWELYKTTITQLIENGGTLPE